MRVLILAVFALASPVAYAQPLLAPYHELSPEKQAIIDEGRNSYIIHLLRTDGSARRNTLEEEKSLVQPQLDCGKKLLDQVKNGELTSGLAVVQAQSQCMNEYFIVHQLPFRVSSPERKPQTTTP